MNKIRVLIIIIVSALIGISCDPQLVPFRDNKIPIEVVEPPVIHIAGGSSLSIWIKNPDKPQIELTQNQIAQIDSIAGQVKYSDNLPLSLTLQISQDNGFSSADVYKKQFQTISQGFSTNGTLLDVNGEKTDVFSIKSISLPFTPAYVRVKAQQGTMVYYSSCINYYYPEIDSIAITYNSTFLLIGQQCTLNGTVFDNFHNPYGNATVNIEDPFGMLCKTITADQNGKFSCNLISAQKAGVYMVIVNAGKKNFAQPISVNLPISSFTNFTQQEKDQIKSNYSFIKDINVEPNSSIKILSSQLPSFELINDGEPLRYQGDGSDDSYISFYLAASQQNFYKFQSGDFTTYDLPDLPSYKKGEQLFFDKTTNSTIQTIKNNSVKILVYATAGGLCVASGGTLCLPLAIIITGDVAMAEVNDGVKKGNISCNTQRILETLDAGLDLGLSGMSLTIETEPVASGVACLTNLGKIDVANNAASILQDLSSLVTSSDCSVGSSTTQVELKGKTKDGKDFVLNVTVPNNVNSK